MNYKEAITRFDRSREEERINRDKEDKAMTRRVRGVPSSDDESFLNPAGRVTVYSYIVIYHVGH